MSPSVDNSRSSNHREHQDFQLELQRLQAALDSLGAYCEPVANLRSLRDVTTHLRSLVAEIPGHIMREEQTVLEPFAKLGFEQARFVRTMRQQHQDLSADLSRLFQMLNEIHDSSDLQRGLTELRQYGQQFVRLLLHHIAVEDRTLAELAASQGEQSSFAAGRS